MGPAPFLRRAAETVQVQIMSSFNGKYYIESFVTRVAPYSKLHRACHELAFESG
jgi:hypothetical protein